MIIVKPLSYRAVQMSEHERSAIDDAAKLQAVINAQEAELGAQLISIIPQARHYDGTERAVHLVFRTLEVPANGKSKSA